MSQFNRQMTLKKNHLISLPLSLLFVREQVCSDYSDMKHKVRIFCEKHVQWLEHMKLLQPVLPELF